MRAQVFPNFRQTVATLIFAAGVALSLQSLHAQDASASRTAAGAPTTFVIFPSHSMPDDEWTALFDAVQSVAAAEKIEGAGQAQFVRGDKMPSGFPVENPIVVFLHGNCILEPQPRQSAYSARLGWVIRENGNIDPYIHVDCAHIGQFLGSQAQGLDRQARDRIMAGAVARVLVHEWIHIARQTAEHGRNGITKASFGVADLLGDTNVHLARR
jgi:hypothetical protein